MIAELAPETRVRGPAPASAVAWIATFVDISVPNDLVELLLESDGAESQWGGGVVWSAAEMHTINWTFRAQQSTVYTRYAPFNGLLFFADAGNGDQFAFDRDGKVLRWDHETDERRPFAVDLASYLQRRLTDPEWS
jgi:hypothetical protein